MTNTHNKNVSFFAVTNKACRRYTFVLASVNILAASSRAPPNRGPMVRRPDAREDTKSLPARAVTMVL